MTNEITKPKETKRTAVYQPLYVAGPEVAYKDIGFCPISNTERPDIGDSLTSLIDHQKESYSDISGQTVVMRAHVGGREFTDVCVVEAELAHSFLVRIGEQTYSVKKSIVKFTKQ